MINKICIAIIGICIILTGCGKFGPIGDAGTSTGNDPEQNAIESVTSPPYDNNVSKTLKTDEKYDASIYYDKGFYFKVDTQTYKLKDDCIDAQALSRTHSSIPGRFSIYIQLIAITYIL